MSETGKVRDWVNKKTDSVFWVIADEGCRRLNVASVFIDMCGYLQMFIEVAGAGFLRVNGRLEIQICCQDKPVFDTINCQLPLAIRHGMAKIHAKIEPDPFAGLNQYGGVLTELPLSPSEVAMTLFSK